MAKNQTLPSSSKLQEILSYRSVIPLVLANTIPIFGVLFFGWDLGNILFLYWAESGVIGFYNILKMLPIGKAKFVMIPFFMMHFGGFMLVHGVFVSLAANFKQARSPSFDPFTAALSTLTENKFAIFALFLSHGYSFVTNYLRKKEWKKATIGTVFLQPYARIIIMHLTLLFGAFISGFFGQPIFFLILLILLKIIVDIFAHLAERSKFKLRVIK